MANTKFTYENTVWTGNPTTTNIPYVAGYNSSSGVVSMAYSSEYAISDDGIITRKSGNITTYSMVNITHFRKVQRVNVTGATTVIDLDKGATIWLNWNQNTVITLTKGSTTPNSLNRRYMAFKIYVAHDDTENVYTLSINQSAYSALWTYGNSTLPVFTQKKKSVDVLVGNIDGYWNVTTNPLKANQKLPANFKSSGKAIFNRNLRPSPKIQQELPREIKTNMIIVGMADLTLACTSVQMQGVDFGWGQWFNSGCVSFCEDCTSVLWKASELANNTLNIDTSAYNWVEINHDADINTIVMTPPNSDQCSLTVLRRKKDDSATPRLINFDPAVFTYTTAPVVTQTANAIDYYYIVSYGSTHFLNSLPTGVQVLRRQNG
jgi:hypothetical protein